MSGPDGADGRRPRLVLRGQGSLRRLPGVLESVGTERVLLITGTRSYTASGAAASLRELEGSSVVRRLAGVAPNPTDRDVAVVLEAAVAHRPDTIVAVGGGSALDTAKLIAGLLGAGVTPEQVTTSLGSGATLDAAAVRLVLVPTTAGSGAEATPFATVYVEGRKRSVAGGALRADSIVLDPSLLRGSSELQRATSGFDAVAQAIESIWAVGASAESRGDARRALRLLLPAIRAFVAGEDDIATARAMLVGSHLAGRAIAVSRTTAAHALSYVLTTDLGLPHGQAVGVSLPALLRAQAEAGPEELRDGVDPATHRLAVASILDALGSSDGPEGERVLRRLLGDLGLHPLPEAAAAAIRRDAELLVARADVERLGNDPLRPDAARAAAALRAAA